MSRSLLPVLAAFLIAPPVEAQDITTEVDRIFEWATSETPGCAVAASRHGKLLVNRAYGLADLERKIPNSPESVFDIGSVQKQFTTASILLLAEEGRLSLSDDVRKHIPELPDYGHTVTINHLLTHTSGVRDWTGLRPLAEGDPTVLTLILRQRGLNFEPGTEFSYSNSGYELLKEVVARVSGMTFSEFTRTRLFEPLGMKSSAYHTDMTELMPNRALGYDKQGDVWKLDMYVGNERGGGALFSTAGDLLIWNDALTNNRLGAFVSEKLHEPAKLNNGRSLSYARALFLDRNRGGPVVWHSGGAAGYSALLSRYPEQGLSIAITCNADGTSRTEYARRIFDLVVPASVGADLAEKKAPPAGAVAAGPELETRAGLFFSESTGQPLRLIVNSGRLGIAGSGPLVAFGPGRFRAPGPTLSFMSDADFELNFLSADEFELKTADEAPTRYRRAQPYTPTPGELDAFAGLYESDELGSVLEMVPEKGGLVMRFHRAPDKALKLTPVERDTFMLSRMVVRFLRDDAGKVTGYDYSNPLVRNIRFTRVGE